MKLSIDTLRRDAKRLRRDFQEGDATALQRMALHPPKTPLPYRHADYLHVVAQEQGFASWPRLKLAAETIGLDRAAKQQRLKIALAHGQTWVITQLLKDTPDLANGAFGLQVALYDLNAVRQALQHNPSLATQSFGPRSAICHLAFSRWHQVRPDLTPDMLCIAELLVENGADVNDGVVVPGSTHKLSALYGAIGHANNMTLAQWFLDRGADPNDGESLYHATELGHHDGLRMLLDHGATPHGTNALLRAMDFHDVEAVRLLIATGAKVDEFNGEMVGGERPWVLPAMFQAARRGSPPEMIDLLLNNGADPNAQWQGAHPYAYARAYGHETLAEMLQARGAQTRLCSLEHHLANCAKGRPTPDILRETKLPPPYEDILREILSLPGRLPHVQALITAGLDPNRPDKEGLTPLQVAGWEGKVDVFADLLSREPDLAHINGYGGSLISTILHGSENAPDLATRDHAMCLEHALQAGATLTPAEMAFAGREDLAAILQGWEKTSTGTAP